MSLLCTTYQSENKGLAKVRPSKLKRFVDEVGAMTGVFVVVL